MFIQYKGSTVNLDNVIRFDFSVDEDDCNVYFEFVQSDFGIHVYEFDSIEEVATAYSQILQFIEDGTKNILNIDVETELELVKDQVKKLIEDNTR